MPFLKTLASFLFVFYNTFILTRLMFGREFGSFTEKLELQKLLYFLCLATRSALKGFVTVITDRALAFSRRAEPFLRLLFNFQETVINVSFCAITFCICEWVKFLLKILYVFINGCM